MDRNKASESARAAARRHVVFIERADGIAQVHVFGRCVASVNVKQQGSRASVNSAFERWMTDVAAAMEEYHQSVLDGTALPREERPKIEVSQPSLLDTNREQRAVLQEQESAAIKSKIAEVNAKRQSVMEETKRARIAERIANNRKSRDARFTVGTEKNS
jgi:hypothetical protein